MTRTEIVAGLLTAARRTEDMAHSYEAAARHHNPEYETCIHVEPPDATPQTHARALELYQHVVHNESEARSCRAEARLFRAAAEMLTADEVRATWYLDATLQKVET